MMIQTKKKILNPSLMNFILNEYSDHLITNFFHKKKNVIITFQYLMIFYYTMEKCGTGFNILCRLKQNKKLLIIIR